MVQATALNGINPLSYMGVNPYTPAPLFIQQRAPTVNDFQNFYIGTLWLVTGDSIPEEIWMLVALVAGQATWVQLYPGGGGGGANEFPCDSGTANEAGGILNVVGSGNVQTSGAGNTVTIALNSDLADSFHADAGVATPLAGVVIIAGGTNLNTSAAGNTVTINTNPNISIAGSLDVGTTSTFNGAATFDGTATFNASLIDTTLGAGVVQTDAGGHFSSSKGTDGQLLIGSTAGVPAWANLTSGDGSIVITNGANSINLTTHGGGGTGSDAFLAVQATNLTVTGAYSLGQLEPLIIKFDTSGSFFAGDGVGGAATFTAPATGYYSLTFAVMFLSSVLANVCRPSIDTPAINLLGYTAAANNLDRYNSTVSGMFSLTAGDVVTFSVGNLVGNTVQVAGFRGGSPPSWPDGYYTQVSGFRVA